MQYQFFTGDGKKLVLFVALATWEDGRMEIKEHRLLLFMELYEKEFGVTLTREAAYEKALSLLNYARLFIRPLAKSRENDINSGSNASE